MTTYSPTYCIDIFLACHAAIDRGELIRRTGSTDKEFHFQNWFRQRLEEAGVLHDQSGRNSYPDFIAVDLPEGYEVKGLAWPGREASYDANSQVPTGFHNGRAIYYVFGRYPAKVIENEYPVIDLVICHGDFINAYHEYVHKNRSVKGFGSYGDIMIRDRKMYVAPTPFALTTGTTGQRTLILPEDIAPNASLESVGHLSRIEAERAVVGYEFDLVTNVLTPLYAPNPSAGREHAFTAYRLPGRGEVPVTLSGMSQLPADDEDELDE